MLVLEGRLLIQQIVGVRRGECCADSLLGQVRVDAWKLQQASSCRILAMWRKPRCPLLLPVSCASVCACMRVCVGVFIPVCVCMCV